VIANLKCGMKSSRRIGLEEIARFPLVLLRSGFCTRELIDEEFEQHGIQPHVFAEFDSIDAIVSCVQEVTAISVLPEHACHWRAYPGVKVIPLSGGRLAGARISPPRNHPRGRFQRVWRQLQHSCRASQRRNGPHRQIT
jgi:DNA-binding transcriptional LysR family regulator